MVELLGYKIRRIIKFNVEYVAIRIINLLIVLILYVTIVVVVTMRHIVNNTYQKIKELGVKTLALKIDIFDD